MERDARLFEETVRKLHSDQQKTADDLIRSARSKLATLDGKKDQLVDFFLEGKIDQSTYDSRVAKLHAETEQATITLRDAEAEQLDIDNVLAFTNKLIRHPARLSIDSDLEGKQRLQRALSPKD